MPVLKKRLHFFTSILIFLSYLITAEFSFFFLNLQQIITPVWLPTGVAVALVYLLGSRFSIAVFFAAAAVAFMNGLPPLAAIGIGAGNAIGVWLTAALLHRFNKKEEIFESIESIKNFLLAILSGSVLTAIVVTLSLWYANTDTLIETRSLFLTRFLADYLAVLLISPFVITWLIDKKRLPPDRKRIVEFVIALLCLIGLTSLSFGYWRTHRYLVFIILTWVSLRFSIRMVSLIILVLGAIAILLWTPEIGASEVATPEGIVFLQLFLAVAQVTSLMLSAALSQQRKVESELREAKEKLDVIVKKRTAKLKLNEQRFKVALQNSPVVVFNQNKKLVYTWIHNPFFGFTTSQIVGKTDAEVFERKRVAQQLTVLKQKVLTTGQVQRSEVNIGTAQEPLFYDFTIEPLLDSNDTLVGINGVAVDITDRKKLEENKDEFLGIASHELRTPLTSIKGFVQILERMLAQQDRPKEKLYLQKTRTYVDRLNGLVADLLDISKIQAGKLQMNVIEFDIDQVVTDAIEGVQYMTSKHKIIKKSTVHQIVTGDQVRIEQVITNLLTNAVKYSPDAHQIFVNIEKKADSVVVSVQDFGFGIEKKEQQRLFQRFYRVRKTSHSVAGLGVGLYVSLEIIKRHGGKMWVDSTEGKGSTFYFSLPV